MPTILIVCTGNICRSPMAQALLAERLRRAGLGEEWVVRSAGTWGANGAPASDFAVECMAERGLDLSTHRARTLTESDLRTADVVLAMTRHHREAIQAEFSDAAAKVRLLSELIRQEYDIPDPYGGSKEEYEATAQELEGIVRAGWERLIEWVQSDRR